MGLAHDGGHEPMEPAVYEIDPGKHRLPGEPGRRGPGPWWLLVVAVAAVAAVVIGSQLMSHDQVTGRRPVGRVPTSVGTLHEAPSLTLAPGQPSGRPTATTSDGVALPGDGEDTGTVATSAGATPRGPRPTRGTTHKPPTTSKPPQPPATSSSTPTQPPVDPTLSVSAAHVDLTRRGTGHTDAIRLTANDGPISWSVSFVGDAATWLAVSPRSGDLAAGASDTVTIRVIDSQAPLGDYQLVFAPGDLTVTVTVS